MKHKCLLSFLSLFAFVITACGPTSSNNDYCIVTFNSNGGSEVAPQKVEKGGKIKKPANPTKEYSAFVNWTYQGEEWSFIGYSVTEDMTLDANWEKTHYVVSFDTDGGSQVESQIIAKNGHVKVPSIPNKTDYSFLYWLYDDKIWSFEDDVVVNDMTLTAAWVYIGSEQYTAVLDIGRTTMAVGEEAQIIIRKKRNDIDPSFSFSCSDYGVLSVDTDGKIKAVSSGKATILIQAHNAGTLVWKQSLDVNVANLETFNGKTYFSDSQKERIERIATLEEYALRNHLGGIPIMDNSSYIKHSKRINLPTTNYIDGYGFGLLGEGSIDGTLPGEESDKYQSYLHIGVSFYSKTINARIKDKITNWPIKDLQNYITSSYWEAKMNDTKNGYVMHPVLAKDCVSYNGKNTEYHGPTPIYNGEEVKPNEDLNTTGLYKTWRIYVKTGNEGGVKFRYNGSSWGDKEFDNIPVTIDDYEYAYRYFLTNPQESFEDRMFLIAGARTYYETVASIGDDQNPLDIWNSMKESGQLGIKTGNDAANGDYLQLTLSYPVDRMTAMNVLCNKNASPLSEDFIRTIGSGSVKDGSPIYGTFNDNTSAPSGHKDKIVDYVLSVGPYMLEEWNKGQTILFKKNDSWNEPGRYNIEGIKMYVIDTPINADAIYNQFKAGFLDECVIPFRHIEEEKGLDCVKQVIGNSIFKLNVNSCTQEMWDDLNKANSDRYNCKPWMSNDNFLNGLFYSIDRKAFATNRGRRPSISYFSDSYLSDPEKGVSYNDTEAHKNAIAVYQAYDTDGNPTYGYSKDRAVSCFKAAVRELVNQGKLMRGTINKPYIIDIDIWWTYPTDIRQYGEDIEKYFTDAFNDPDVSGGTIKLEVNQQAVTVWDKVYTNHLKVGWFDLAFFDVPNIASNPFSVLEDMKSESNLNWSIDTSKVNTKKPLIYNNKIWSFDALLASTYRDANINDGCLSD